MTEQASQISDESDDGAGFAARLRAETAVMHEAAERSAFMGALVDGRIPLTGYVQLLGQYLPVYDALESVAAEMRDDPVAGAFALAELDRKPAIEADLAALGGPSWAEGVRVTAATASYAARIRAMADWPGGFVAHHYVRYLGDLSGGQIVRRILRRVYELPADDGGSESGTSFYVFDGIESSVAVKRRYRQLLDEAPWDADERDRVVAEAVRGFELNVGMFASLAPEVGVSS